MIYRMLVIQKSFPFIMSIIQWTFVYEVCWYECEESPPVPSIIISNSWLSLGPIHKDYPIMEKYFAPDDLVGSGKLVIRITFQAGRLSV